MATKINGKQIDIGKAPITGSNSTLLGDAAAAGLTLTGSVFLLANPTESLQAATKAYVDSVAGGGVTVNQIAYGNADSDGVSSDGGLIYSPNHDILGVSGSIEFGGVTGNSIHGDDTTGLNLSGTLVNVTSAAAMVVASTTFDVNASSAVTIDSSAGTIGIGTDDVDQNINIGTQGERDVNISTGAFASAVTIGNVTGATSVNLNAGTGGIALASTGAGDITLDSDDTMLLDADGVLELNSSAGAIGIGTDDVDQNINIGTQGERDVNISTGAFASTVNIGNETGATALDLDAGTGGITIDSQGAGTIAIGTETDTGAINIGIGASARTITVGNDASTKVDVNALAIELDSAGTVVLDSTTSTVIGATTTMTLSGSAVDVDAGSGALSLNSSGAAINIGNDDVDAAINIGTQGERTISVGTGAFAADINIGNETGATALDLDAGTGGVTIDSQGAGIIAIGTQTDTGAINIGVGASARTITVGNDASTKVDVNALAIELDSAGSIVLDSTTSTEVTATTTMAFAAGDGISLQALDGGITMTGGAGDQVSVVLGAAAGAETFGVTDNVGQTQFSVGSAGAVSFGDGAWDYSSTSLIAEPAFYFTSSVLLHNIANAAAVPTTGQAASYSGSLGASGEFFNTSPAVYLNGLRIRSGTTAQVTAGTRDYYSLKVTEDSVNYLVVSMSAPLVTGDVLQADFRRSS